MSIIPSFPQYLLDMHHNWHQAGAHPGGGPGRAIPAGQPGSGLEFLTFHRNFVAQFHAWYDSQPFANPAAVAEWTAIPAALKNPALTFWNSSLAGQEARIVSNTPPFATADELGIFIEAGIHNWIHGATATVYSEPEVGTFHSPRSTYFYNIHGLVDFWWRQWVLGHKSFIKDIIDTKHHIKEVIKDHKEFPEKFIKDKELPEKLIKEKDFPEKFVPDKPFKEKDKDLIEGGDPRLGGDPPFMMQHLEERVSRLEAQAAGGQAFIRPEERPDVGASALAAGHAGGAGVPSIEHHPDENARPVVLEEQPDSGKQ